MKHILILAAALAGFSSTAALSHPHGDSAAKPAKKTWPYFGESKAKDTEKSDKKSSENAASKANEKDLPKALKGMEIFIEKHTDRMSEDVERAQRNHTFPKLDADSLLKNPDDLREAARALEEMLAESDILENMADMVIGLAENIEVDSDDDGLTLRFNGETLGNLNIQREGKINEAISIEGLGRNMNVEKDVIIKNGKKRTRIVIEMDTDEDVDIDVIPKE